MIIVIKGNGVAPKGVPNAQTGRAQGKTTLALLLQIAYNENGDFNFRIYDEVSTTGMFEVVESTRYKTNGLIVTPEFHKINAKIDFQTMVAMHKDLILIPAPGFEDEFDHIADQIIVTSLERYNRKNRKERDGS